MRKKLLFTVWLLVPIVVLAFHYGPGQKGLARDQAAEKIKAAQLAEADEDWKAAVAAYADALTLVPADQNSMKLSVTSSRLTTCVPRSTPDPLRALTLTSNRRCAHTSVRGNARLFRSWPG